ncbi:hypothetical protein B6U80_01675 [Candidatus Pacearchaeota archaeon ex4484_26]|nr:MAG: hypothetical protein B6U80_01675 [Candidatus Pacearchaeota archaeon ex4484_26]
MIQARYRDFLKRISKESGLEDEEIDKRVKQKQATLGGLVTLEGAALIVANELGIKFDLQQVKISELMTGMRNVDVLGKIIRIYPIRTYKQRDGQQGKVGSFLIADETGSVRVVLWDTNHIALIENGNLKEDQIFLFKKADVRGTDIKELHLSGKSAIEKSDKKIKEVKLTFALSSSKISELKERDRALVRATIVQTFPLRFFPACPICRKRLAESEGRFYCVVHKEVQPRFLPVFSFYIDDGSANIRAVCFLESALKLFALDEASILNLKDNQKEQEEREKLLGKEFIFEGRTRKNDLFDRMEFVINSVSEVNTDKLIEELKKEVKKEVA